MNIVKPTLYISLTIVALLLSSACRKKSAFIPAENPETFLQVFDDFWNGMSVNYVYWHIDTTNWDVMYEKYRPLFAQLDLHNERDVKKSVSLFRQMTKGLIDGHYYIDFTAQPVKDSFAYPAYDRKRNHPAFHNPYPYPSIAIKYLDAGYYTGIDSISDASQEPVYALCGTIQQQFLYFYCNRFSLYRSYSSPTPNTIQPLLQYFFAMLQHMPDTIKKVIIDVRGNRGGDISDLNFIAGRFIDKPLIFGYTRYKSKSGRLDYTPWVQAQMTSQPGAKAITKPIVVLADNFSASLAELMTMAIQALPNGTFIGEPTFGATGPLTSHDLYADGSFDVTGFMTIHTASAQFKYLDGTIYEGSGFPPDTNIPFNFTILNTGKDIALETAIKE